jgi:GWxTD domain-containing protein
MKNSYLKWVFHLVILLLMTAACQAPSKVSLYNLVSLYQKESQFAPLESRVYHTSDTSSTLFVEVLYSNLVYQKDPYTGLYACSYRLSYKLTTDYESKEILQTSSVVSGDSLNYGKNSGIVHSFEFKAKYPGDYLLEISLFDFNRQAASVRYLDVKKTSMSGSQSFLVLNSSNSLVFRNYVSGSEPVKIVTDNQELPFIFVNLYDRDFPVARPPYTEDKEPVFEFKPDSTFVIPVSNGETDWITLSNPGFYHFRKDTNSREGLTLYHYHDGFPELFTADELKQPLRYITTRKEYDTLMTDSNSKAAVDNFWLKTAQSPERAKVLIQKYYSNVEEANEYFTSYVEGWKTDRGLIYIVFGRPDYVYRGKDSEEWIYGEPQNRSSLRFTFVKVNNHFSDNDYMLLRSPTLKEPWFVTVQSWRR